MTDGPYMTGFGVEEDGYDPTEEIIYVTISLQDPKLNNGERLNTQVAIPEDTLGLVVDDDEQYMATTLKMASREIAGAWKRERERQEDDE